MVDPARDLTRFVPTTYFGSNAGKPTLYKPEMAAVVNSYLQDCRDEWDEFHKTRGEKSDTYERTIVVRLPSYERFAQKLKVSVQTLFKWGEEHPEFQEALDKILAEQKSRLMEGGLSGTYNSTISKLILSANHGMQEKTEMNLNVRVPKPILDIHEVDVLQDNSNQENPALE